MHLPSRVRFADKNIKHAFTSLDVGKHDEKQLQRHLISAFKNIERDCFCGIQIPGRQIPKEYLKKHPIDNLWKYNLPGAWRLIYTIEKRDILIVAIVLEWLPHDEYDRRFKY